MDGADAAYLSKVEYRTSAAYALTFLALCHDRWMANEQVSRATGFHSGTTSRITAYFAKVGVARKFGENPALYRLSTQANNDYVKALYEAAEIVIQTL